MPLPMVHLGVARKIALKNTELIQNPLFYLGSIAPDAIHSRVNYSKLDKCKTHIRSNDSTWYADSIKFSLKHKNCEGHVEPFYIGYVIHILTDLLWEDSVHSNMRKMMDKDNIKKSNQRLVYDGETDQLDFELFKFYQWKNEVWCFIKKANAIAVDDVLTKEEVDKWRIRTLHWYDSGISRYNNSIKYLNFNILNDFVNNASDKIIEMIMEILM